MRNDQLMKRNKLLMLAAVFILPMVVSALVYFYRDWFHLGTNNHGVLVQPPVNVSALWPNPEKKWRVLYLTSAACNADCQHINFNLTQMIKLLGKNQTRVHYIHLARPLTATERQQLALIAPSALNKIYLIDPEGNLFMYYEGNANPISIVKDLKHVLEVSQIG